MFTPRAAFAVTLLVSLGALGTAFIAQYVFGLKPCELCLWQRVPYVLLALDALAFWILADKLKPMLPFALAGMGVLALASAGLALTHFGVEQHWWVLDIGCKAESMEGKSEAEALAALLAAPVVPCDEVAWRILGLSATFWNMLLSLGLSAYLFLAFRKARRA